MKVILEIRNFKLQYCNIYQVDISVFKSRLKKGYSATLPEIEMPQQSTN